MSPSYIFYRFYIKRLLDIIISAISITVLSPLLVVIALMVKINLGSPVIYTQLRPGKNEKIFTIYKFRTMSNSKDDKGQLLPDELRLTRFGRWLRSTSLDEMPELFNVLKGDMSIIGPRPLLVKYLPLYNEYQRRRHEVKPGISGLAQINGRNAISWEEKFALDVKYIETMSFRLDIKIAIITIIRVLRKDGINAGEVVTMPEFIGSSTESCEEVEVASSLD